MVNVLRPRRWLILGALVSGVPVFVRAQGSAEVVRGTITGVDEKPIAGADVTVTGATTGSIRRTQTDLSGRYLVVFLDPEGAYTVFIRRIGFTPALTRALRTGGSGTILASATLVRSAYVLEPLVSAEQRRVPVLRLESPTIGGAGEQLFDGGRFVLDPGDLAALASLALGVQPVGESGYSVMGTSADQNSMLVDGMNLNTSRLPPDAVCGLTLSTTTSDPSRGRFAGGQASATTCRGQDYRQSEIRGSLLSPSLAVRDASSGASPLTSRLASGFIAGPLRSGVARYRLSAMASDRSSSAAALLASDNPLLTGLGLQPDSIAAVASALGGIGVPTGLESSAIARSSNATGLFRVDWNVGSTTSLVLTTFGSIGERTGQGVRQVSFPSTATKSRVSAAGVTLRGSTYFFGGIDELTGALNTASFRASPESATAAGSVVVGTILPDGRQSVTPLQFGGAASASANTHHDIELRNRFSWGLGNGHKLSFGQEFVGATDKGSTSSDSLGTFEYLSIADLVRNRPAMYTRTIGGYDTQIHTTSGALWLGDIWPLSTKLSVEAGLRADFSGFSTGTGYNAAVDSAFGRRTDRIPNDLGVSPRAGFAWLLKRHPPQVVKDPVTGRMMTRRDIDEGDIPGIARGNSGAGITLFGGIGAYRGVVLPATIASLATYTGLPGAVRTLTCIGNNTPMPDWTAPRGTIFDSCVGASGSPSGDKAAVPVRFFSPMFQAPTNWRGSLGVSGLRWKGWTANAVVVAQRTVHAESWADLNLSPTNAFALSAEHNRPVYASPGSIDALSGLIQVSGSRLDPAFGQVTDIASDLHGKAVLVRLTLNPPPLSRTFRLSIGYAYNASSLQIRGFNATTAGDPNAVETISGSQPLHQIVVSTSQATFGSLAVGARLNLNSGIAYTPLVAGDVNGDGLSNDRAFIFGTTGTTDPSLAAGMSKLLSAAPGTARRCLVPQTGAIAGPNSCRGPWQLRLDVSLELNPSRAIAAGRLHVTASLLNAGAGLLQAFGLGSAGIAGSTSPDSRLLYVTGFDPARREFRYAVNQNFGQSRSQESGDRSLVPFQVRVGAEYDLGAGPAIRELQRLGLDPKRASGRREDDVRRALQTLARNPVDSVLKMQAVLLLSREQIDSLRHLSQTFERQADSIIAPLVTLILQRGSAATDRDIFVPVLRIAQRLSRIREEVRDAAMLVLGPEQQRLFESAKPASDASIHLFEFRPS